MLVGLYTCAGVALLVWFDLQLVWGLPVMPNLQLAGTLLYFVANTQQPKAFRRTLYAATVSVAMSISCGVLLTIGLAYPETTLGDVALFQVAIELLYRVGDLVRYDGGSGGYDGAGIDSGKQDGNELVSLEQKI